MYPPIKPAKKTPAFHAEKGEGSTSYLAVVLLIASITAAIATSGIGGHVESGIRNAICRVAAGDCSPPANRPPAGTLGRNKPILIAKQMPDPPPAPHGSPLTGPPEQRADETLLRSRPHGQVSLTWMRLEDTKSEYRRGGGNRYDATNKVIYLDTTTTPEARIATYEAAMAAFAEIPTNQEPPDPLKLLREPYIDAVIRQEVDVLVAWARVTREVQERGGGAYIQEDPVARVYNRAYDRSVHELEAWYSGKGVPFSEAQKREAGDSAGRHAVYNYHYGPDERRRLETYWNDRNPRRWKCLWIFRCP